MAKSLKNQSTDLNFQTLPSEIVSSGINTDQSLQLSTFNTKSAVLRSRPLTAISLKPKSSRFSQDQAKPKKPKLVKLRPFATDQPKKQQE